MHRPKRLKMAKPAALAMAEASADPARIACGADNAMIARASQLFLPTLRDAPADAEARSATSCSCAAASSARSARGLWTFLPLGWRVHRKVEQIIREEMDAIGGQELLTPVLTPIELWEATGRDYIPEIFRAQGPQGPATSSCR